MGRSTFSHNTQDSTSDEEGSLVKGTVATAGKRRHVCTICKQSFNAKGHLNRHKVIHSGEQNHKCFICERSFSQRDNLQRHLRTVHKGEKSYECDTCKRSFSSKAYLRKHVLVHYGENPICPICNKSFVWHLDRHLLTHNVVPVEKPHVCNICEKSFTDKRDLKRHIFIHAGENPYVCNICSAAFPDERYLMKHKKKRHYENDEKHSQTPVVDNPVSNFSSKSPTLSVHMKRHAVFPRRERSFICRVCDKSFTREQCLRRHLCFHFRKSCPNRTEKKGCSDPKEDRSHVCGLCSKKFAEETCLKLLYLHCKGKYKQHPYSCQSCLEGVLENDEWNAVVLYKKVSTLIPEGSTITNLGSSADTNGNYPEESWPKETEIKEDDNDDDMFKEEHDIDNDFEGFGAIDYEESDVCKKEDYDDTFDD